MPFNRNFALRPGLAIPIGPVSFNASGSLNDNVSRQLTRFFTTNGASNEADARGVVDQSHSRSYRLGLSAAGTHKRLNWSFELTGSLATSQTNSRISRKTITVGLPSGSLTSLPTSYTPLSVAMDNATVGTAFTANAPVASLPAGEINGNTRLSMDFMRLVSTYSSGQLNHQNSSQVSSRAHFGLGVPLTGPDFPLFKIPGTTSLSLNGDYEQAQHVGGMPSYDLSWQWQPINSLSISLGRSMTGTLTNLGSSNAPVIYTPGTLVVDAVTGNYALVTEISGGTPNLRSTSRNNTTARLSFNKTVGSASVAATVEYISTSIENPIISTVSPNPQFQLLFPDRFTRDATGQLTSLDIRPFNAYGETINTLRPNIHVSGNIVTHADTQAGGVNWDFSLSDEWGLSDELRPTKGTASVDVLKTPLDGVRGTPRHKIDVEAEASYQGFNAQLSADWRSGSHVQDVTASAPYSVHYASFWTANATLSYSFRLNKKPFRVWLSVSNILNRRPIVQDSAGHTPEAYQPAFLDPIGRVFALRASIPL